MIFLKIYIDFARIVFFNLFYQIKHEWSMSKNNPLDHFDNFAFG